MHFPGHFSGGDITAITATPERVLVGFMPRMRRIFCSLVFAKKRMSGFEGRPFMPSFLHKRILCSLRVRLFVIFPSSIREIICFEYSSRIAGKKNHSCTLLHANGIERSEFRKQNAKLDKENDG